MTARDMDANIARALGMSTKLAARYDRTIVISKGVKTMQFLVMNSRVYQQHTHNKFMSLLHLKKGSTEKKTPGERMRKGYRFERLRMLKNRSWRIPI